MLTNDRPAKLIYGLSDFRVIAAGDYVLCAVTGVKIPLNELRYWNAERQEAYVNGEASAKGALAAKA